MKSFFEWVQLDGNSTILEFTPKTQELMNIPCLFDNWYSEDQKEIIQSFAIITREPEPEVLEAGHDRSPLNLKTDYIEEWLRTDYKDRNDYFSMLNDPYRPYYEHKLSS